MESGCRSPRVHDTAMAILAMSRLLTVPLVDVSSPKTGILNANRENGTTRVSFHGPDSGAIAPAEKMKKMRWQTSRPSLQS